MGKLIVDQQALDMGHYGITTYRCSECYEEQEDRDVKFCKHCGVEFTEKKYEYTDYPFGGSDF